MANPNPPLDQPDPWEPDRATCEAVQELTERLTRRLTDRESGESFTECLACGEVDSHLDSCPVPMLEAWLEGPPSRPTYALNTQAVSDIQHGPFVVGTYGLIVIPVRLCGRDTDYTVLVAQRPSAKPPDPEILRGIAAWVVTLPPKT